MTDVIRDISYLHRQISMDNAWARRIWIIINLFFDENMPLNKLVWNPIDPYILMQVENSIHSLPVD